MARRGAICKYDTKVKPYLKEIEKKVKEGIPETDIAEALGISIATLNNYKNQFPELREVLANNKGADVLNKLINAGIKSALGYTEENETIVVVLDENGEPTKKQKTIQRIWYPPNPALNQFYVKNFGKKEGFVADPLDYELKKAKQEFDIEMAKAQNWEFGASLEDKN